MFALDFRININDNDVLLSSLAPEVDNYQDQLKEISQLEGMLCISFDGEQAPCDYEDPIIRLADQWVRRLSWIIAGDTETFPLRNSEHCFAFVPTGDSVEVSFFEGTESEVDDYVIEPTKVRLDELINESIRLVEQLMTLIEAVDPKLIENDEDCVDLARSLNEAKNAWHEYQVRQRR